MAIQMRRGVWSQFDPTKMLPGEWAVILSGHPDTSNGQALYHCFAAGSVKQIATIEDAATIIANATEDIREELTQDIASALAQVSAATNAANTATANANTATSAANAATQAATSASERAEDAIEAMGDISELAVPLMTPDTRGGAKLEEHGGLALRDGALGIGSLVQESDGYARGGLAEVTAKGHAEQFSTTGKNLLAPYTVSNSNVRRNADGSVTIVSLPNSGQSFAVGSITLVGGQSYAMSGAISSASYMYVPVDGKNKSDTGNSVVITPSADQTVYVSCVITSNSVVGTTFYPMLRLASITDDTYEPYTGGAPSPSPDYPQEIQVVRGRNLLDVANVVYEPTYNDVGTSTWKSTAYGLRTVFVPVEEGKEYVSSGFPNQAGVGSGFVKSDKVTVIGTSDNSFRNNKSWGVAPSGAAYLFFGMQNNADLNQAQLTLGSTPQPYVPYGHVGMEVQGRNLWGGEKMLSDISSVVSDKTIGSNAYGKYIAIGAPQGAGKTYLTGLFKENTQYTLVLTLGKSVSTAATNIVVYYTDGASTQIEMPSAASSDASPQTFAYVTRSGKTVNRIGGQNYSGATYFYYEECGLFEGIHTVDEFEPYYHETCAIPLPQRGWVAGLRDGTADSLRLDGAGKCEWTLPTKMRDLGELTWQYDAMGFFYTSSLNNDIHRTLSSYQVKLPVLCSHYIDFDMYINTADATWLANTPDGSTTIHQGGTASLAYLYVKDSRFTSVPTFLAFLAQNPVTVLYSLATPVTEDCGYVEDWPTDLPEGATVTIPELDEVGITYFVDSAVTELARQWYERANSEYADRITALEQAVAELVTS